jgi:peptidoglycan/xylan/chitin deacetylase (PgdA/CDA1 family)
VSAHACEPTAVDDDGLGPIQWPDGARCAVMLSFDFDAETLWTARDPANAQRLGTLSQGVYGAQVGIPKILETLRDAAVPATFFVPGWTAEHHRDKVVRILAAGHEVGHHGHLHLRIDPEQPEREREEFARGLQALQATVGVQPLGYRSPGWEVSALTMTVLQEHGLLYDSSMMDHVHPYRHTLPDGRRGPIELPVHWSLDDAPLALFSVRAPKTIVTNAHLLQLWQDEFREIYRWGGLFNLTMHPQVIGRPSRIALLREFIGWLRGFPGVWFARGADIATAWAQQEARS